MELRLRRLGGGMRVGSRIVGFALAAIIAGPTLAADLPTRKGPPPEAPPSCLWCGFYGGVNLGDASGTFSPTVNSGFPAPPFVPGDVAAMSAAQSRSLSANGFIGGAQAGYNFQHDNLVWGFEADFDYLGLKGSKNGAIPIPSTFPGGAVGPPLVTFASATSASTNWLITVRPRLGWAMDNWLLYVTGGLAVGQESFGQTLTVFAPFVSQNNFSETHVGWTVGVGAEYALTRQWSLKAEYLYVDLGKSSGHASTLTPALPPGFGTFAGSSAVALTANIGRVGLNYHF
jgi:outer membrane immunogenic protein